MDSGLAINKILRNKAGNLGQMNISLLLSVSKLSYMNAHSGQNKREKESSHLRSELDRLKS